MQWSASDVKGQLLRIAGEMEAGVGNINSQFALFRYEITEMPSRQNDWKNAISEKTVEGYAKNFLIHMEKARDCNKEWKQKQRIEAALAIYNGMKEITG